MYSEQYKLDTIIIWNPHRLKKSSTDHGCTINHNDFINQQLNRKIYIRDVNSLEIENIYEILKQ